MDCNAVRRLMRRRIARYGSQAAWAREIGETPQALSTMLTWRVPSRRVLVALDLEIAPVEYRSVRQALRSVQNV